jgi:hypothetical protein
VWLAVFFWAAAVMFFGAGWAWPRELERGRHKAQAAADYATEPIGRSSHSIHDGQHVKRFIRA